ncbi:MAG: GHKL domain-containing protein [Butyrivibrio sp.]|nr:GHKL domain-containing protein [Butyrivibrio sp.]
MSSLIDDLLTLAKSDEIDDEYVFESFNLSETALNILPSYSESTLSRGIRLQNNIQPNIIFNGNREMIEKLITILMDNAIKYTKENGEIILSIAQNGSKINMDFYNTADISEDYDLNNLFNRFYRPDNSRNSSTGGHGIGLSIAKKIVKNHGGMIIAQKKDNGIFFSTSFRNR